MTSTEPHSDELRLIVDFFDSLTLEMEEYLKFQLDISLPAAQLEVFSKALKVEASGICICDDITASKTEWYVSGQYSKASTPEVDIGSVIADESITTFLDRQTKRKEPESTRLKTSLTKDDQKPIYIAVIPFSWKEEKSKRALIFISEKELSFNTRITHFIRTRFEWLEINFQDSLAAWQTSYLRGSRHAAIKQSHHILNGYSDFFGKHQKDFIEATALDSYTRIAISNNVAHIDMPTKERWKSYHRLTNLAEYRENIRKEYQSDFKRSANSIAKTIQEINHYWQQAPFSYENFLPHPDFTESSDLFVDNIKQHYLFTSNNLFHIDCLRTILFCVYYKSCSLERKANHDKIDNYEDLLFNKINLGGRELSEALLNMLNKYLNTCQKDGAQIITSEWLFLWFGCKLLDSKEMWKRIPRRLTPRGRCQYYQHFCSFFLYLLHIIRCQGRPRQSHFSDVPDGYDCFFDSLLFLLADYTHENEGLSRRIALYSVLQELWSSEGILYAVRDGYRDHLHHVVNVCLLGLVLIDSNLLQKIISTEEDIDINNLRRNWILAGLLHDVGYILDLHHHLMPHLHFLKGSNIFNDFQKELGKNSSKTEKQLNSIIKKEILHNKKFEALFPNPKLLKSKLDHGITSAVFLLFLDPQHQINDGSQTTDEWLNYISPAVKAVSFHNIAGYTNINPCEDPLSFLLLLCDHLQEWDRPRPQDSSKLRRQIATMQHQSNTSTPEGSKVVRAILFNSNENEYCIQMVCHDHYKQGFEPAMTWYANSFDFQGLLFEQWPQNFSLQIQMSHQVKKKYSFEFDLLEDFFRQSDVNDDLALISWISDSRSQTESCCWHYSLPSGVQSGEETFSWTFSHKIACPEPGEQVVKPNGLYGRFLKWKHNI